MHKAILVVIILALPVYWMKMNDRSVEQTHRTQDRIESTEFERNLLKALPNGSRILKIEITQGMRISFVECPAYNYVLAVTPGEILGYRAPKDIPLATFLDIDKLRSSPGVEKFRHSLPADLKFTLTGEHLRAIIGILES